MNSSLTPERRLARTLQSVGERYAAACTAARRLQDALEADDSTSLTELQRHLTDIAAHEHALADARRDWERGGRPGTPELRQLLAEQTARLEELLAAVQGCLNRLEQARDRLRPELDVALRRQAMQRAYGAERRG